ncbi:MAG: glycosyltransferase [Burkholderiaceae bacterium]|nr:glycosyltransferase [Burkholderiaceae bacterium]
MTFRTLAAHFEAAREALEVGRHADAIELLDRIDPAPLPATSAALHAALRRRAAAALGREPLGARTLLQCDRAEPRPGISLVGACMNREANLLKVLPSWLASGADEIIVVDWSSREPLWPQLAHIEDPRLKVVRIDDEPRWILTHAFNVGLRLASHEVVFKLDADIALAPDFLARNRFGPGEFVRGFWKAAVDAGAPDQRYVNGSFGAFKSDLRAVGYYNERILTYGWDDSDLYARLSGSLGRAGRLLAPNSLTHLPQEEALRLENQSVARALVLGRFSPAEHENLVNKYGELTSLEWAAYHAAQDYRLQVLSPRRWQGERLTTIAQPAAEERHLARVLAMRQLVTWRGDLLPPSLWSTSCSLEFARLLEQAQRNGRIDSLITALQCGRGLHLISAKDEPWRRAVEKTLGLLHRHKPECAEMLVLLADDGLHPGESPTVAPQVLRVSARLVEELAGWLGLQPRTDLDRLEPSLAAGPDAGTSWWRVDAESVAASAAAHADALAERVQARLLRPATPAPRTVFATSVYDETNLLRLIEYLACITLNLGAVERLLLMYESRCGVFQLALQSLCRQRSVSPGRLTLIPFDRRPTFEELFALQGLCADGTLFAVANADVVFDASLADLASAARDDHVYVLSRWDLDAAATRAQLIRLESGVPNTFSADAWLARVPFRPDFRLDYEIGSFHCDSYINQQIGRSQRYLWANPCLDVRVFHLHDPRFNSSSEKHARDKELIELRYRDERARNDDRDPLNGAPWCTLAQAHIVDDRQFLVDWRPKFLVLDLSAPRARLSGLIWLHLLRPLFGNTDHTALVLRLRAQDLGGPLGRVLAHYKRHFGLRGLFFEIDDTTFDAQLAPRPQVLLRPADPAALLTLLERQGCRAWTDRMHDLMAWPTADSGVAQMRCDLDGACDEADTRRLIACLRDQQPESHAALTGFLRALDVWSEEGRLVTPFLADLQQARPAAPALVGLDRPRVSLVTSLFRGGAFLPGYLENVAEAALAADGEVVLIDANTDGRDSEALERFFRDHPEVRRLFDVVTLSQDPGLYACWQLAIERSRGCYVGNANLDDRRSPEHTRLLVEALEARPHLAGAAGSISAVFAEATGSWFDLLPNQVWFADLGEREFGFDELYARNPDGTVRSHNIMHCMPVWRRSLHDRYGSFDEARYGTSADWAFWLKCAQAGERFWLQPQAFGRYFVNPESHNRRHDVDGAKERAIILDHLGVRQDTLCKQ